MTSFWKVLVLRLFFHPFRLIYTELWNRVGGWLTLNGWASRERDVLHRFSLAYCEGLLSLLQEGFRILLGSGWCGSVDWEPAWEPKDHPFDSQSGHRPGLPARSPVGVHERQPCIDVSLPLLLPPFPSLKINKSIQSLKKIHLLVYLESKYSESLRASAFQGSVKSVTFILLESYFPFVFITCCLSCSK